MAINLVEYLTDIYDKLVHGYVDVDYDIECMGNFFCLNTRHEDGSTHVFRLNDKDKFLQMYNIPGVRLWGIYNSSYDDIMMKAWLKGYSVGGLLYLSNQIVNLTPIELYREIGDFNELKDLNCYNFITGDLFKLIGKSNGLKMLGIIIGWGILAELPFEPGSLLSQAEKELMLEYCHNDTGITLELLKIVKAGGTDKVSTRASIEARDMFYDDGLMNAYKISGAKLAEEDLIHQYLNATGIDLAARSRINHTKGYYREEIPLKDVMVPITFNDPTFQDLYDKYYNKVITFSMVEGRLTPSSIKATIEDRNGRKYTLGIGGLHSSDDRVYLDKLPDDKVLILSDVAAYYPNLMRSQNMNPGHIKDGFFPQYITNNIKARDICKAQIGIDPKAKAKSDGYKLKNNSGFGKWGDPYSPLYDFSITLCTTMNGQMKLLKLIDMYLQCSDAEIINANTDGVAIVVSKKYEAVILQCNRNWEVAYDLELEEEYYTQWFQKSCNNYLAKQDTGKIKGINEFATYYDLEKGMTVAKIVPIAVREYLVNGVTPEVTVTGHNNLQEFLLASKKTKQYNVYHGDTKVAKINRYYKSVDGKNLISENKDNGKVAQIPKADSITLMPNISDFSVIPDDINYAYYINEAWNMINSVRYGYNKGGVDAEKVSRVYSNKENLVMLMTSDLVTLDLKCCFSGVDGYTDAKLDDVENWITNWQEASAVMVNLDATPRLHVIKSKYTDASKARGLFSLDIENKIMYRFVYSDELSDTRKLVKLGNSWYSEKGYDIISEGWVTLWGIKGSTDITYTILWHEYDIFDAKDIIPVVDYEGWKKKTSPTTYMTTTPGLYLANEMTELSFQTGTDILEYIDSLGFNNCEKEDAPMFNLWKSADTQASSSLVSNAVSVSGMVFDVDGEKSMSYFMDMFGKYKYGMFTTGSHTPDKHKFRFILPFTKAITKQEYLQYKESMKEVMHGLVDISTLAINRRFYLPTRNAHSMKHVKLTGKYFKMSDMFEAREAVEIVNGISVEKSTLGTFWYEIILPDLIRQFSYSFNENNRHHAIVILTKHLSDAGYNNDEVYAEMQKVPRFVNRDKYSEDEIMMRINDVIDRY